MLKKPLPARTRKLAGSFLVAMIVGCGTWAAWAAQPTQPVRPVAKAPAPTSARKSDAPQITRITDRDQMTSPVYPAGVTAEGNVEIELHVGADGKVKDVKILKSEPAGVFDQATIDAAMKWKVTPPMKNGVPVEGRFRTVVEYRQDPPKPGAKS